jgi:hypothetical protein
VGQANLKSKWMMASVPWPEEIAAKDTLLGGSADDPA